MPPPPQTSTVSPTVLFVGDSLTLGFAASDPAHTYAEIVIAALGGTRIGRGGQYGISAVTVAEHLAAEDPLPPATDVVVELSTNDHEDESKDTFMTAYEAVLMGVRMTSPRARLVCLGPWQSEDGPYPARWQTIQTECAAAGGISVSLFTLWRTWSYHGPSGQLVYLSGRDGAPGTSDWFHPNNAGHAAIARLTLEAFAYLAQRHSTYEG